MEFSRQYLTRLSQESNFIKDALEKVLRLSEILQGQVENRLLIFEMGRVLIMSWLMNQI